MTIQESIKFIQENKEFLPDELLGALQSRAEGGSSDMVNNESAKDNAKELLGMWESVISNGFTGKFESERVYTYSFNKDVAESKLGKFLGDRSLNESIISRVFERGVIISERAKDGLESILYHANTTKSQAETMLVFEFKPYDMNKLVSKDPYLFIGGLRFNRNTSIGSTFESFIESL